MRKNIKNQIFIVAVMLTSIFINVHNGFAGETEWEAKIKHMCELLGPATGPSILEMKARGASKDLAISLLEQAFKSSSKDNVETVQRTIAVNSVKEIYQYQVLDMATAAHKVRNICIKEYLKDDPTGAKTKAREKAAQLALEEEEKQRKLKESKWKAEAERRDAEEKAAEAKAEAEREKQWQIEAEERERKKAEEAEKAKETKAIYEKLNSIRKETEKEINKANYLPTLEERVKATEAANKKGEEREKQLWAERAQYISERLTAKRAEPGSAGKTDSQLRDEIREEDRLAKERQKAEADRNEKDARANAAMERKKAQEEEARLRKEKYEEERAKRQAAREEELRKMGVDTSKLQQR